LGLLRVALLKTGILLYEHCLFSLNANSLVYDYNNLFLFLYLTLKHLTYNRKFVGFLYATAFLGIWLGFSYSGYKDYEFRYISLEYCAAHFPTILYLYDRNCNY